MEQFDMLLGIFRKREEQREKRLRRLAAALKLGASTILWAANLFTSAFVLQRLWGLLMADHFSVPLIQFHEAAIVVLMKRVLWLPSESASRPPLYWREESKEELEERLKIEENRYLLVGVAAIPVKFFALFVGSAICAWLG